MTDFPADALTPVTRTELRPAYVQIADQIRRVIRDRGVANGAKMPIESELVERFGVSRMTVREGLRVLRLEGLLRAEHGVGVFVDQDTYRAPTGIGGSLTPSEATWREGVMSALRSSPTVGPVGQHEEIWASLAVKAESDEVSRIDITIADQPGRYDYARLYVPASSGAAVKAAQDAVETASRWVISVRGAGPGDGERAEGDLLVTRTAYLADSPQPVLVARSRRSSNWSVTVSEVL